jgi:hypothetical protein
MIVDRYDPVNLFALVPKLMADFEPELHGRVGRPLLCSGRLTVPGKHAAS